MVILLRKGGEYMKILLNTLEKVKNFVKIVSIHDGEIILKSGHYEVDAKSILGIFSLDLTKPMDLIFLESKPSKKLLEDIKYFLV